MARPHSSASKSWSIREIAVISWRRAKLVISPCMRAWAPERGGLGGIGETHSMRRGSGVMLWRDDSMKPLLSTQRATTAAALLSRLARRGRKG